MTSKRVTFDLMNLGMPVNTDPYDLDRESLVTSYSLRSKALMSDKLLTEKLLAEAKNMMPDFFLKDPSSSDDSMDDYDFPETMSERVRALSFARRRRLHYNEFASVPLARRLIREEFASETSSVKSEDSAFLMQEPEEECSPCVPSSDDSYPYFQYERSTNISQGSDESGPREDPEPGFDPKHPCYQKLTGQQSVPVSVSTLAFDVLPDEEPNAEPQPIEGRETDPKVPTKVAHEVGDATATEIELELLKPQSITAIAAVSKDLQESLEKDTASMAQNSQKREITSRKSTKKAGFRSV